MRTCVMIMYYVFVANAPAAIFYRPSLSSTGKKQSNRQHADLFPEATVLTQCLDCSVLYEYGGGIGQDAHLLGRGKG